VEGLFMKNWDEDDGTEYCTARQDLEDAARVCDLLGIRLHQVNFAAEYWDQVFEYFLSEYQAGRTPNPDILCNREIKFRAFLDYARVLGADLIATGHYAGIEVCEGRHWLTRAADENKDQTYFLYAIGEKELSQSCFPLADVSKPEVRRIAAAIGLGTHSKKDSTGICFIGERKFRDFLARYLPAQPGPILDIHQNPIGEHHGALYYTQGQRKGLGIGGTASGSEAPWFVVDKDVASNTLYAVQGADHPGLFARTLVCEQIHWITSPPTPGTPLMARIRHRQPLQACQVTNNDTGTVRVTFESPQRAVTPGQSIVFYSGQRCLGGAIIASRVPLGPTGVQR
jgi:tRNA-specific 2-thiouridylase